MPAGRICLYFRTPPESNRWFPGDRFVRPLIRRVVRGKPRLGGVEKVFANLCAGLNRLGFPHEVNLPFKELRKDDLVGVLGRGRFSLEGYDRPNAIVAGIGLMTHPSEWPTLCEEYPVVTYLQHSEWTNEIYKRYFGNRCCIWPVGINTDSWTPATQQKDIEILLYDKVLWERARHEENLIRPIKEALLRRRIRFVELRYGHYTEAQFRGLLGRSKAMIFLCEHESQGLAYQECLSSGVPVLAWDQGWFRDPNRFKWGDPEVRASSVPYFDPRCGSRFASLEEFATRLDEFLSALRRRQFDPRAYIMENLTLEKSAQRFVDILRTSSGPEV